MKFSLSKFLWVFVLICILLGAIAFVSNERKVAQDLVEQSNQIATEAQEQLAKQSRLNSKLEKNLADYQKFAERVQESAGQFGNVEGKTQAMVKPVEPPVLLRSPTEDLLPLDLFWRIYIPDRGPAMELCWAYSCKANLDEIPDAEINASAIELPKPKPSWIAYPPGFQKYRNTLIRFWLGEQNGALFRSTDMLVYPVPFSPSGLPVPFEDGSFHRTDEWPEESVLNRIGVKPFTTEFVLAEETVISQTNPTLLLRIRTTSREGSNESDSTGIAIWIRPAK